MKYAVQGTRSGFGIVCLEAVITLAVLALITLAVGG